jgi:hypothetical protein
VGNEAEANALLDLFGKSKSDTPFTPFEVGVRYSNRNEICGQFNVKAAAIAILRGVR